jgi:hypothetical protein
MADQAPDFLSALNEKLRPLGVRLEFDGDELWLSARDEAALHAFNAAHGAVMRGLRGLLKGEPVSAKKDHPAQPVPDSSNEPLERWRCAGGGIDALAERLAGGAPPQVLVQQVTTAAVEPPSEQQHHLPEPPRTESGLPYIDADGFRWRARRDAARARGERFTEMPPYRWVFG